MSEAKYPNRYALNRALDHYLDAMFQFVSECLDEQSIRDILRLQSSDDLRKEMEVKDIAKLIRERWSWSFKGRFKIIDRDDIRYYDARSVTSLIIKGRNQVSHQLLRELDPEFTRSQLFLIAEILGKIKRSDVQREVEIIRDKLFEAVENSSAANNETAEANHTPKLPRANAKVTVEDVSEIRSRSASGESNSDLAKEFNKKREKKPSVSERYKTETTVETRDEIAVKVAELRINIMGSKRLSWRSIREKLGLKNDQFHKVIRLSEGYRNAVIERIKSLKSAEGGWEYNGKLSVLTGIEDIENYLE